MVQKNNVKVIPNSDVNRVEPGRIYNNDVPEELDLIV